MCSDCLDKIVRANVKENRWDTVNKLCQWADVPFIPEEWEKVYNGSTNGQFANYCKVFGGSNYATLTWRAFNEEYIKLNERNELMEEVPGYKEAKYEELRKKWGPYENSELDQLEHLFNETISTQNVNTGNQIDQLKKICRTSLLIDQKIAEGQPYKDLMDSYTKLITAADLTPKNTKNSADFDSVGEVYAYLESKGWINKFYDGVRRDEVDETIHNIQNWTRKLCISESTLTEEILQKLNNLNGFDENDITDYDAFDYEANEQEAADILKDLKIEVDV